MSKLWYKYGAMNCGKSTKLMQEAHNYEEKGMRVFVIKPSVDKKADTRISSRIGLEREVDYLVTPEDDLIEFLARAYKEKIACIMVDEAQFLTKEQVDSLYIFTKKYSTPVICYGLKTDFQSNFFPGSKRLFELSDAFEELKTICSCGRQAKFNARKIAGEFVLNGDQIAIDGIDATYESLCGECYLKKVKKINF